MANSELVELRIKTSSRQRRDNAEQHTLSLLRTYRRKPQHLRDQMYREENRSRQRVNTTSSYLATCPVVSKRNY